MKYKISWSLLATVYWSREEMEWMIKVFLLEICPYVYYVHPLIKGRLHLVRDTAAEKEVDIAV